MSDEYVHGRDAREAERLRDQAATLAELLHHDTHFPDGARILEAGCGVGAQTVTLAAQSPDASFLSFDISADSLREAEAAVRAAGLTNVRFAQQDVYAVPFETASFDHVVVNFMLEHLRDPIAALRELSRVLRRDGTLTVIEGDHGSAYFSPDSESARRAIASLVELQHRAGGDALIGRRLYPLLREAGFIDEHDFAHGIADLYRAAEPDGVFNYTFFKAVARRE